ncbi:MAG: hypothetical protein CSA58_10100 [Micrococcales bacterium]|nr:MAG: hypothetical protein CSA58_10100 [Micrococcales bacterium]
MTVTDFVQMKQSKRERVRVSRGRVLGSVALAADADHTAADDGVSRSAAFVRVAGRSPRNHATQRARHLRLMQLGAETPVRPVPPNHGAVLSRPSVPVVRTHRPAPPVSPFPGGRAVRLTRRGRRLRSLIVSCAVGFVAMAAMIVLVNSQAPTAPAPVASVRSDAGVTLTSDGLATITVQEGDSLWRIARTVAPQSATGDVVAALRAANGLTDARLTPGQVLIIPRSVLS